MKGELLIKDVQSSKKKIYIFLGILIGLYIIYRIYRIWWKNRYDISKQESQENEKKYA